MHSKILKRPLRVTHLVVVPAVGLSLDLRASFAIFESLTLFVSVLLLLIICCMFISRSNLSSEALELKHRKSKIQI